jgi:formylglycine-generating enzyme required for sulfatase activity
VPVTFLPQAQWDLIQPSRTAPSYFNNVADRAMRPVEQVSYNEIRNAANSTTANTAYDWPIDPNPSSFLGLLRTKTGLDFDLPSEAQWEFAARAGNGDTKWGDGSGILNSDADANLDKLGRHQRNGGQVLNGSSYANPAQSCGVTNGTAIVGSYLPNAWGLYDMHGNVWEWCLDWYEDNINAHGGAVNIDPSAPAKTLSGASGASRVARGGSWNYAARDCRPAYRGPREPSSRYSSLGFRVLFSAGLR